ncbi:hypothetical protein D3C81_2079500 [compost metagenome]
MPPFKTGLFVELAPLMVILADEVPFLDATKFPVKVTPAASVITSPGCALARAVVKHDVVLQVTDAA